jgi:hypothetical protein
LFEYEAHHEIRLLKNGAQQGSRDPRSATSPELPPRSHPTPRSRPKRRQSLRPFSSSLHLSVPANPSSGTRAAASGWGLGGATGEGFIGLPLHPPTARATPAGTSPTSPHPCVPRARRSPPRLRQPPAAPLSLPPILSDSSSRISVSLFVGYWQSGTPSRCLLCALSPLHSVLQFRIDP